MALGLAQVSTYPPDVKYVDLYLAAQDAAQAARIGIWSDASLAETAVEGEAPPSSQPQEPSAPAPEKPQEPDVSDPEPVVPPSNCDPSYPDVCIPIGSADDDCAGGSGNGPHYITGPIRVLPPDP